MLSNLPKATQLGNSTGYWTPGLSMSYKRIPPGCPPSLTRAWDESCNIAWDGLRKMLYWRKGPRVSEK